MREAVLVFAARTPIGKAYRGAFNNTQAQALGGHVIAEAVRRAKIEPGEVGDVIMGSAMQQGSTGMNTARQCAIRAGLPSSIAGMSIDRQCASGLMAIAAAAKEIVVDGLSIAVRVRIADGPPQRIKDKGQQHLPGEEAWDGWPTFVPVFLSLTILRVPHPLRRARFWFWRSQQRVGLDVAGTLQTQFPIFTLPRLPR
jgi:hypothetical protein